MLAVYAASAILRKPACCNVPRAPAGQGARLMQDMALAANTSPERILDDGGCKVALCERAVDRTPGDAETLRDRSGTQRGPQLLDLCRINADRAAFVLAGGLRLRDAFALA